MVALKTQDIDRHLATPDSRMVATLIYGPDIGLVSERCMAFAVRRVADVKDPFQVVRLDGDVLASDPMKLADEANTISFFAGKRLIWIRAASRPFTTALEPVLRTPPSDATILIEAGDFSKSSPLRALAERSPVMAALPCYMPDARDVGRLVDNELAALSLNASLEAKQAIMALIGADRLASRAEIRKIALYAHPETRITLDHVEAVCGDASAIALDEVIDCAFAGQTANVIRGFGKLAGEGHSASSILGATLRHAVSLIGLCRDVEGGRRADEVASRMHFKRKPVIEQQLRCWSSDQVLAATGTIGEALRASRRASNLAPWVAERCLLSIASMARRRAG